MFIDRFYRHVLALFRSSVYRLVLALSVLQLTKVEIGQQSGRLLFVCILFFALFLFIFFSFAFFIITRTFRYCCTARLLNIQVTHFMQYSNTTKFPEIKASYRFN